MGAVRQGTQRLSTFAGQTTLEVEVCTCGVLFAAPRHILETRREDGKSFYCPNGHCLSYDGDIHRLKRQKREADEAAARALQRERATRDLLNHEENSHRATRGHLTRQRRRAAAGVCPCCKRTFRELARHMNSKHPDYVAQHGTKGKA